MGNKKKPNLAGIQEFGAAAYVKDSAAGKLSARAKKGRFIGYDSESKGYRIYWPDKHSITIKRNMVFNQDDVLSTDETHVIPELGVMQLLVNSYVRTQGIERSTIQSGMPLDYISFFYQQIPDWIETDR